jgi:hypothetical protein
VEYQVLPLKEYSKLDELVFTVRGLEESETPVRENTCTADVTPKLTVPKPSVEGVP